MMKSTGIIRKPVFTKEGKIGVVKDIIIENGPVGQERSSKGFASPDWWVPALEIELDEPVKTELVTAKKLAPSKQEATYTNAAPPAQHTSPPNSTHSRLSRHETF